EPGPGAAKRVVALEFGVLVRLILDELEGAGRHLRVERERMRLQLVRRDILEGVLWQDAQPREVAEREQPGGVWAAERHFDGIVVGRLEAGDCWSLLVAIFGR